MNEKLKSVIDKIAKLRALAAGATTQGEAEAAAAQAAALAAKYQIDEAQVETAEHAEEIGEGDVLWASDTRNERWRSVLASGLAGDHGCAMVYASATGYTRYRIAGRPSDVALVRYLFAWLHVEIARLSERERGKAARNAFRLGAVAGVLRAMQKARAGEAQASEQNQTAALAIVGRAEQSLDHLFPGRKPRAAAMPSYADRDALRRGLVAGAGLAPRPGLTGGEGRFMLGTGK